MTGLEKILKEIQDEAQVSANAVLTDAQNQAAAIAAQAQEQGKLESARISMQAQEDTADIKNRAESSATLLKRKTLLAAKQQTIGAMLESAHQAALGLEPKAYFAAILKMVKKYALPQDGEIIFSKKDFARLPSEFAAEINKTMPMGAKLTLSKETREIDGGFVLLYGGIEQNCSFSALFDAAREPLQDKVHTLLFLGGH